MSNITKQVTTARIGEWTVDLESGVLRNADKVIDLEPTPLLMFKTLISKPGEVISKDELIENVWPDRVVGDDALSQTISRLRRALGDNSKHPQYIQTVPRKGYRLAKEVELERDNDTPSNQRHSWKYIISSLTLLLVAFLWLLEFSSQQPGPPQPQHADESTATAKSLTNKADDFYFQYTRADNEAAIDLYQQAMATKPSYAPSQSGLANALVQKVLRWPGQVNETTKEHKDLLQALNDGRTKTDFALQTLQRAEQLALRSVRLDPNNADIRKALGLVYATQSKFELAEKEYKKALQLNPNAWGAMINLSDIYQVRGESLESIKALERAFEAMNNVYDEQAVRVRPWQAGLGNLIGERYSSLSQDSEAKIWFKHVLSISPYHPEATENLIKIIFRSGDSDSANLLCKEYESKIGELDSCQN